MRITLLLAACTGSAPPEDTGEYTPAPYIYDEEDPPIATLDPADLEVAIDAAASMALSLNAKPLFPAYDLVMAGADDACPNWYDYQGSAYWYDQCTSDAGTSFSGYSFYTLYDNYDAGDGGIYNGTAISGVAQITSPEGYTYVAGGSAYDLVITGDTYTYYYSVIAGSFGWDGPGAEDTWLTEGVSPDLTLIAYTTTYGDLVEVDGGLSGLGGDLDTVVFDAVTLFDESLGSTCPTEPGGVVSVRDVSGDWYDVVFDGPTEYGDESDPDLCDGCGAAYYRGEYLGQVCSDFTGLLSWEGTPW